jgi:hypothetical protein
MKAGLQRQARLHYAFPKLLSVPDTSHHLSCPEKMCEKRSSVAVSSSSFSA